MTLSNVRIFYTCQQQGMYYCNFIDYESIIVRIYGKKTVVNFMSK